MITEDVKIKGFTLVEVLVALALFSGLMLTLFSAFNAFTSSGAMIRERQDYADLTGPGLSVMAADLNQVFILHPPQFQKPESGETETAQNIYRFTGGRELVGGQYVSFLRFASLTPVQPSLDLDMASGIAPGLTRLAYYVHEGDNRLSLHRADQPSFLYEEDREPDPCADPVLAMGLQGFSLIFVDREGEEHDSWDSGDEDFQFALPARVDIVLTLGKEEKERVFRTSVTLPVNRKIDS